MCACVYLPPSECLLAPKQRTRRRRQLCDQHLSLSLPSLHTHTHAHTSTHTLPLFGRRSLFSVSPWVWVCPSGITCTSSEPHCFLGAARKITFSSPQCTVPHPKKLIFYAGVSHRLLRAHTRVRARALKQLALSPSPHPSPTASCRGRGCLVGGSTRTQRPRHYVKVRGRSRDPEKEK